MKLREGGGGSGKEEVVVKKADWTEVISMVVDIIINKTVVELLFYLKEDLRRMAAAGVYVHLSVFSDWLRGREGGAFRSNSC